MPYTFHVEGVEYMICSTCEGSGLSGERETCSCEYGYWRVNKSLSKISFDEMLEIEEHLK
mgnify:FL=1|jgi:hypothetical protein